MWEGSVMLVDASGDDIRQCFVHGSCLVKAEFVLMEASMCCISESTLMSHNSPRSSYLHDSVCTQRASRAETLLAMLSLC